MILINDGNLFLAISDARLIKRKGNVLWEWKNLEIHSTEQASIITKVPVSRFYWNRQPSKIVVDWRPNVTWNLGDLPSKSVACIGKDMKFIYPNTVELVGYIHRISLYFISRDDNVNLVFTPALQKKSYGLAPRSSHGIPKQFGRKPLF